MTSKSMLRKAAAVAVLALVVAPAVGAKSHGTSCKKASKNADTVVPAPADTTQYQTGSPSPSPSTTP